MIFCARHEERSEQGATRQEKGVGLSRRGMREGCGINVISALYTSLILESIKKLIESLMGKICLL